MADAFRLGQAPDFGALFLGLLSADVLPTPTTPLADYTIANYSGYSSYALPIGPGMPPATWDGDTRVVPISAAPVEFAPPPAQLTIYGWLVWSPEKAEPVWYERFATPIVYKPGETLRLSVALRMRLCEETTSPPVSPPPPPPPPPSSGGA